MPTLPHFRFASAPRSHPEAMIRAPGARFTVLTPRLIRMEHDPAETFEDRPSQAFWFRQQPVPAFTWQAAGAGLTLETDYVSLTYAGGPFTPATLRAHLKTTDAHWTYGDPHWRGRNLMGTARTLDDAGGHVRLEPGLMARDGWAVVDDSASLVFTPEHWLTVRTAGTQDLYLFAYGQDFPGALREFRAVCGATPLIPRWALGNWWSRYWAYTEPELVALVDEFAAEAVPLAVCIIDMDWHLTRTGNASTGWTGYTWNPDLFPDPERFLSALHARGVKTSLNLHPAEGVHAHEAAYPAMAAALGREAATREPIAFDLADPDFARAYFEVLHHPLEAQGVDFWWIDWQQGQQTRLPGLDPLWWLNHLHAADLARTPHKRPFLFSRWGGLGNHRYPLGFSGDTHVTWDALAFQPRFTATASNVGYSWWSHDIGGHMGGVEDDELYTRWVQFGVFSPILRLHSTKNAYHERRPWRRGPAAARYATEAMRLRHQLIPYLYSMARRDHQQAAPLIQPMYYSHPAHEAAYACPQQYWFGSELIAAPFTTAADPDLGLSRQTVWLPDGDWYHFFTGEALTGGWRRVYGDLADIPVFARAGAIVPLAATAEGAAAYPRALTVHVFAGPDNRFELYEDDGESQAYQTGEWSVVPIQLTAQPEGWLLTVGPVQGDTRHWPANRQITFCIHGVAESTQVWLNADLIPGTYASAAETLSLRPVTLEAQQPLTFRIQGPPARRDRRADSVRRLLAAFRIQTGLKQHIDHQLAGLLAGTWAPTQLADLTDGQALALLETARPGASQ